jgi:hypothetical protein
MIDIYLNLAESIDSEVVKKQVYEIGATEVEEFGPILLVRIARALVPALTKISGIYIDTTQSREFYNT